MALFPSVQASCSRCHATVLALTQNSETYFSYSHTLTLTVTPPVTVALLSLPTPTPPFSQWCDGPHCGVVVVLQYRTLLFYSFPGAPQKDASFSAHPLGRLASGGGLAFNAATGGQNLSSQTGYRSAEKWSKLLRSLVCSDSGFGIIKTNGLLDKFNGRKVIRGQRYCFFKPDANQFLFGSVISTS